MKAAIGLIVVVIAGLILWFQFDAKTEEVRSLNLQVTGHQSGAL